MNPALSETRNSLIMRLHDQRDIAAWDQFVTIYGPLILRLARSKGFQDSDANDIVQEVMLAISKAIHRWDPDRNKGRFRDWLFRIARNMMINFLTRRKFQQLGNGQSISELLQVHPAVVELDSDATREFDLEYRRELFWVAADKVRKEVRPNTWEAFQLTAIEELSVSSAARKLGMKEGAVLVARCRVLARLRNTVAELEGAESDSSKESLAE
ncbi:MAG: sigma-70 family RNA polymerase sigma factor [Pirellulales bacterium]